MHTIHILNAIHKAFFEVEKPVHFCNYKHCCECAQHDQTLIKYTRETISFEQLGYPGWDPVCFINTNQGFQYYLPALARLSLQTGDEYYLSQFLFHLNDERINSLITTQRDLLADFLETLLDWMPDEIEDHFDTDNILEKIMQLRDHFNSIT